MDARNAGGQDKIVSVLHAQLKRVHGRLARTEALLRDEREARRDAERQLRERDNGAAAPTRELAAALLCRVLRRLRSAAQRDDLCGRLVRELGRGATARRGREWSWRPFGREKTIDTHSSWR